MGVINTTEPSLLEEFSRKGLNPRSKTLNLGGLNNRPRLSVDINGDSTQEYIASPLPPEILKRPTATTALTVSAERAAAEAADEARVKNIPRITSADMTVKDEKRKKRITIIIPDNYDGEMLDDMGHLKSQTREAGATDGENNNTQQGEEYFRKDMNTSLSTATSGKLSSIFKALGKKSEDSDDTEAPRDHLDQSGSLTDTSFSFDNEKPFTEGNGSKKATDTSNIMTWKPKLTLKSHLDSVRSIDFHSSELMMASGSQDGTVKLWNLSSLATLTKKASRHEFEPCFVYRGHRGPVTCVTIDSEKLLTYSASFDNTIKAWKFPNEGRRMQDSIEPHLLQATFSGHKDIVWSISLQPESSLLASCCADGTVNLWTTDVSASQSLKEVYTFESVLATTDQAVGKKHQLVPVSVAFLPRDPKKLLVGYRNSHAHLVDIETGRAVVKFKSDQTYDGTPFTQLNCLLAHPTLPVMVSGHEDRYIRLFDINTGECSHSMIAHVGPISSLDINAAGNSLVSGAHDASIRWWDLSNNSCVQEFSSHMSKSSESVFGVKFHPRYPWLASCGADSIVKLFSV
ncbi:1,2-dihydroxy-3-keto-5-methylthiopentene dioxygenase [Entomophthora muscae]|uniref:1,2-dihydroxy-3-keto-5-methylthiopentene dioxygenase n=1 Tax=Entomophthora muscae TaxID=34485 RepID=A0ACC2SSQ9_9FUNG|nr:1,2-dihydroxy-3-keto-5-methylthiopentene dioxygenase [Entomophthora muscae]